MSDTLTAATSALDPRRHAVRADLADKALEGRVTATKFVEGTPARVIRSSVPLRKSPEISSGLETEALFGETAVIFDTANAWSWVQLARDGYVGYLPADTLSPQLVPPTHRVQALGTFLYPRPDIKSPALMHIAMNAPVAVLGSNENFAELLTGGYVVTRHLSLLDKKALDFVEVAERFIGTPYLWGGRTRIGIDCSGLVQTALQAAGIAAPRDSDMQLADLGETVLVPGNLEGLKRGDLVFWRGHVGIMADGVMLVHANAHHMAVAVEPLEVARSRIVKTGGGPIAAVRRLNGLKSEA